jgi:hypothetical protein
VLACVCVWNRGETKIWKRASAFSCFHFHTCILDLNIQRYRLPTAAAWVRAKFRSCGICGGQSGIGIGFLRVLRFPLPIFIPPTVPDTSSTIRGWYNRPVSGRRTKWTHSPHLTHSWSWAFLKKLPTVQPFKDFPAFYGTRRFITAFTRALHWSLFWARSIQSISSHPISLRFTPPQELKKQKTIEKQHEKAQNKPVVAWLKLEPGTFWIWSRNADRVYRGVRFSRGYKQLNRLLHTNPSNHGYRKILHSPVGNHYQESYRTSVYQWQLKSSW